MRRPIITLTLAAFALLAGGKATAAAASAQSVE